MIQPSPERIAAYIARVGRENVLIEKFPRQVYACVRGLDAPDLKTKLAAQAQASQDWVFASPTTKAIFVLHVLEALERVK